MANSTFSNLSSRASGTLSDIRGRFGGSGASRSDGGYGAYQGGQPYGRGYREPVIDPYDDLDDVSGIGEVRTRAVSNDRYHPPLLSFNEARVNTYVDRLRRESYDRSRPASRRFEHPGANYMPRVRESVNVGHSSEYDDQTAATPRTPATATAPAGGVADAPAQTAAIPAAGRQPVSASGKPISASGFDPFASFQRTEAGLRGSTRRLKMLTPSDYSQAADIARVLKEGDAVVLMLAEAPGELAKRILDFSFGVASALDARVECIADRVFAIARGQKLAESEREQLRKQGIIK